MFSSSEDPEATVTTFFNMTDYYLFFLVDNCTNFYLIV